MVKPDRNKIFTVKGFATRKLNSIVSKTRFIYFNELFNQQNSLGQKYPQGRTQFPPMVEICFDLFTSYSFPTFASSIIQTIDDLGADQEPPYSDGNYFIEIR